MTKPPCAPVPQGATGQEEAPGDREEGDTPEKLAARQHLKSTTSQVCLFTGTQIRGFEKVQKAAICADRFAYFQKAWEQKKQLLISCFTSSRHFKQARDCSACLITGEEETRILSTSRVPHFTRKVRERGPNCGSPVQVLSFLSTPVKEEIKLNRLSPIPQPISGKHFKGSSEHKSTFFTEVTSQVHF